MSFWAMSIWRELGIKRTRDRAAIARAYGERLAEIDPETAPGRAEALCAAYRRAHRFCDAMESGPLTRIAPRRPGPARSNAIRDGAVRPSRAGAGRAQEVGRAVEDLTGSIVAALGRNDPRSAVAGLQGLARDPLFGNLRLRWLIEQRLLEALGALPDPPVTFCAAAVAAFDWDKSADHLTPETRCLADSVCTIVEGERRVAGLRRLSRHWAVRMWVDRRVLAAALLSGPYRPLIFRLAAFDPLTARAVKRLLAELRVRHARSVARALDRRVIAWWDHALETAARVPARPDRAA